MCEKKFVLFFILTFNYLAHFQLIWMKVIIFYLESGRAGRRFSSARCRACLPSDRTSCL